MNKALDTITKIIAKSGDKDASIRSTALYNEGWMLRLVLQFIQEGRIKHPDLTFPEKEGKWFSEGLLPSPFVDRRRENNEGYTHADGIVGKFGFRDKTIAGIKLSNGCDFFYAVEDKMFSELSKSTTKAEDYSQPARYIGCLARLVYENGEDPSLSLKNFDKANGGKLAFYVVAPEYQLKKEKFKDYTKKTDIRDKLLTRKDKYLKKNPDAVKDGCICWLTGTENIDAFFDCLEIKPISWESFIFDSEYEDISNQNALIVFYRECLKFNGNKSAIKAFDKKCL